MKRIKLGIAIIMIVGLVFGSIGVASAKTTSHVHKSATHIKSSQKTSSSIKHTKVHVSKTHKTVD